MKHNSLKISSIMTITAILLSSCSTMTPMSPQVKQTVHSVRVDDNIQVTKDMYYMTPSSYLPVAFGGLLGAAITAHSTANSAEDLRNKAIQNHVNIDQIVRDQFIHEINLHQTFKVVNNRNFDATLLISIPEYGVSIPTGLSTQLSPIMTIDAKLVKNGNVIWSYKITNSLALSGVPRYTIDEINKNPLLLKEMWSSQADIIVNDMIKTM